MEFRNRSFSQSKRYFPLDFLRRTKSYLDRVINPTIDLYELAIKNQKNDTNTCHCGFWPLKPILVTPSYIRSSYDTNLHEIWKASLEELRTAEQWIMAGYSLPSEDFNIKSLFLGALNGRTRNRKLQLSKGDEARMRHENFFGKDKFDFKVDGLEIFH